MTRVKFVLTNVTEFELPDGSTAGHQLYLARLQCNLLGAASGLGNFTRLETGTNAHVLRGDTTVAVDATGKDEMVDALVQEAQLANADEECLDELVHDMASMTGSTVNNQGMEAQVRYVLDECGVEEGAVAIREVLAALPREVTVSPNEGDGGSVPAQSAGPNDALKEEHETGESDLGLQPPR